MARRKTQEEFNKEIYDLVGNEYTFLEKYKGTDANILVRHNVCGHEYKVRPANFLRGRRCPKCNIKNNKILQPLTNEEFCKRIKSLVGNEYIILGKYVNSQTKIKFKHTVCGNEFDMLPNNFVNHNQRCPKCMQKQAHETQTRTHEEFIGIIKDLVSDEYSVVSKYIKSEVNLLMKHNKCGTIYSVRPNNFINGGKRCPECAKKIVANKRTVKINDYEKQLFNVFSDEYTVLKFTGMKNKTLVRHNICNKKHWYDPYDLLNGTTCVYCGKLWKKTNEYFVNEVKELVGDEYTFLEEYNGADNNILVRHNLCGTQYSVRPANFLHGKRCPACMESTGERAISTYLDANKINYQREFTFDDCKYRELLRFDFAIFKNNQLHCLIEYDGEQHFKPIDFFGGEKEFRQQVKRDRIKDNYCKENQIKLIRIPYPELDNINEILKKCL